MKKFLCTLLLMVLVLCGCAKKEDQMTDLERVIKRGKLVVGVRTDARPFGYLGKDNKNYGFDIDLATYLANSLLGQRADNIEFVPVTLRDRIAALNSGKVDCLIATMSITQHRKKLMDFSKPYYKAGQAILVNSDSKLSTIKELNNKKVIIAFGSATEENIRQLLPNSEIIGYRDYDSAVNALKAKTGDALIADDTILMGYTYDDKSVKILSGRYSIEPYAVAFRKGENSQSLREYTDKYLEQYARTGRLSKLQQKWSLK